ncbi:sugar phosphate isomerase/epimerase family protein [Alcaligenaceae bacterium B3P038]|nr:sugar phosphate isomerase/epimerase family protein [Alcaligenaceae bacterium B3P038]
MTAPSPHHPLFINTILLGGTPQAKIAAAHAAGFDQIELWRQDLDAFGHGPTAMASTLRARGIGLTDYQVLMDVDGAPDARRTEKRNEALTMLDTAAALGADTVLAPASTDRDCIGARIVDDLGWLATQARQRGLRVAYEAMAWSTVNPTLPMAWQCVQQVGADNLGMVIDAFHIFARGRDASDLEGIPMDRIFLVQLSDLDHGVDLAHMIDTARHSRLLPGHGQFPLPALLARLLGDGYRGPIGLEVFNDALKARAPEDVAHQAMTALNETLSAARNLLSQPG